MFLKLFLITLLYLNSSNQDDSSVLVVPESKRFATDFITFKKAFHLSEIYIVNRTYNKLDNQHLHHILGGQESEFNILNSQNIKQKESSISFNYPIVALVSSNNQRVTIDDKVPENSNLKVFSINEVEIRKKTELWRI